MIQWYNATKEGRLLSQRVANATDSVRQWWRRWLNLNRGGWKRFVCLSLVGVSLSLAIASCNTQTSDTSDSSTPANKKDAEITLVSYAVTRGAYAKIIPQFTAKWKKEHNQKVKINQSYGASGSQARAVIDGLEADVVALALDLDIAKIEQAGLIQPGWKKEAPNNAIVAKSVIALVTREDNPKRIKTWSDLAKNGIQVITANPKTSGGARWNFLALWGAVTETGGSDTQALNFTTKVFQNVPVLPRDSREASDVFFKQGQADALINYENEIILARLNGLKLPYVVPNVNISVDSPVAVVDKYADKHDVREVAEAFVQYLYTPEAQREFAKVGFRSVNPTVAKEFSKKYIPIKKLFTVQDLGGWNAVQKKFFDDGGIFDKIQTKISK
ncbi:sulfate ABC transporter substrate-binding protein [Aerosakkonemataceae cyanobacterium BLCC-F154]|uniref:Sulfate ABC transporter substrate-binding protein n=1 Tax=Floridaenema fluviatile BLCC-F154 TaxID=3153640 RepID=A0ABV4YDA0_9CYAN